MGMPVRRFGATGWELTTVGLGTWALGGGDWAFGWGPQDDAESIATIHHAVEAGINWLDTAAEYGLGHSEEIVGRALAEMSETDRPLVFTKCAMVWDPNTRQAEATAVGDAASLRAECEASLRRLGVDCIDLYQVHWPPTDGTALEDYWTTLVDMRASGKVRAIGLSNHDVDQLSLAEAVGHVDSLQPPLSAINRAAAADVIPWCDRLQPHPLRPPVWHVRPDAIGAWRLAPRRIRLHLRPTRQPGGRGGRRRRGGGALDERGERRDRLDVALAGGHRGDRRGAAPGAGRRLAGRGGLAVERRRPGHHRRRDRAHRCRQRAVASGDCEGLVTGTFGLGALSAARSRRPGRRRCATACRAATDRGCR
jgi:diketogulonate reductase-like aldo/keto reductase